MKILLLSENATIQKLFSLSVEKRGDELFIGDRDSIPDNDYKVVFIDKDILSEGLLENLKNSFSGAKFILILNKKDEKIPGFDEYIYKPFLPTDLIDMLDNLFNKEGQKEDNDEFDLENFDDFSLDDEDENFLIDDNELEEEVDEKDDEDDFLISDEDLDDFHDNDEFLENNEPEMKDLNTEDEDILDEDFEAEEDNDIKDNLQPHELDEEAEISDEDILDEDFEPEIDEESNLEEELKAPEEEELKENEEVKSNEENLEEEIKEDNLDLDELENINEKELAEAIGEDLGEELEKESENEISQEANEENIEKNITNEEIKKEVPLKDDSMQKTLGNILNINWEELKKAKAKVTITIDFGG